MINQEGDFNLNPNDFNIEEEIKKDTEKALSDAVCPTHGEKPDIKWKKTSDGLKLILDCCCEELEKIADQKLNN